MLIIGVDFHDTVLRKPLRRECFMWPLGFRGLRESWGDDMTEPKS